MQRASYTLISLPDLDFVDDKVFIVDDSLYDPNLMSLTNAAEQVTQQCYHDHGNKRIIYRDTMRRWDEMVHDHGLFIKFQPYDGWTPLVNEPKVVQPALPAQYENPNRPQRKRRPIR